MIKNIATILIFLCFGKMGLAADIERFPTGNLKAPWPALIVVHDLWGNDGFTKREVEKFSDLGFYVLGVDLYNNQLPSDLPSAQRLKNNLDTQESLRKISKAYEKLASNKRIDKTRIGILGWGMGGGLALRFVVLNPHLRTVTSIYGDPIAEQAAFQKMKVNRGLALFAENDQNISSSKVSSFKKSLEENNHLFEVKIIKGAKPGFFDSTRSENFNPKATEESRELIKGFLQKHLSLTEYRK